MATKDEPKTEDKAKADEDSKTAAQAERGHPTKKGPANMIKAEDYVKHPEEMGKFSEEREKKDKETSEKLAAAKAKQPQQPQPTAAPAPTANK